MIKSCLIHFISLFVYVNVSFICVGALFPPVILTILLDEKTILLNYIPAEMWRWSNEVVYIDIGWMNGNTKGT